MEVLSSEDLQSHHLRKPRFLGHARSLQLLAEHLGRRGCSDSKHHFLKRGIALDVADRNHLGLGNAHFEYSEGPTKREPGLTLKGSALSWVFPHYMLLLGGRVVAGLVVRSAGPPFDFGEENRLMSHGRVCDAASRGCRSVSGSMYALGSANCRLFNSATASLLSSNHCPPWP